MIRQSLSLLIAGAVLVLAVSHDPAPSFAKEYNKRQHLAPEQRAKVDRVIARSRNTTNQLGPNGQLGQGGANGDVTNVGCGGLEIGNSAPNPRRRGQPVDNVVVVTGDVINVAQGCRNRRR